MTKTEWVKQKREALNRLERYKADTLKLTMTQASRVVSLPTELDKECQHWETRETTTVESNDRSDYTGSYTVHSRYRVVTCCLCHKVISKVFTR